MTLATVAGCRFEFDLGTIEARLEDVEPEPVNEHYVVVRGRRYPPKQVLAVVTGLDRADFTTHQARAVLRRVGFGVYRRSDQAGAGAAGQERSRGGAEAALLQAHLGQWVAQDGLEVLFAAPDVETVLAWLRRHGRRARVWQVPAGPHQAASALSMP